MAEEDQKVDQGGTGENVAVAEEAQEPDQGGTGQKVAELAHDACTHGYPSHCHEGDPRVHRGFLLQDMRIACCLCGAKELWHADWMLKNYGSGW